MLQSMRSSAKYIWWFLVLAFVGSFLLYETSGIAGSAAVTTSTAVATVNGEDILYTNWQRAVAQLEQEQQQRLGHSLTLDERRTVEDQAFDQMVNEILLKQEYKRRGISVTDDEIRQAALTSPPPGAVNSPDLQTDGKFDPEKYRRLLSSSQAKQSGTLQGLEAYYRQEIPRQKLFDQVSSDVYLSDERLWQIWRDRHDSATVSFVTFRTAGLTDTVVAVSDAEISAYYERHKKELTRPGRAVLSLLTIPRNITAEDTAATKARMEALRAEIMGGAKFEDVARRESFDSTSGANGGSLGMAPKGRFVGPFETAMNALKIGEVSQPVLTSFGYHLIKVEQRKGDSTLARHIQLRITQSDSNASRTDRKADELAAIAGSLVDQPTRFDSAAKQLNLTPGSVIAIEKEVLNFAGRQVPGASGWAFSGSRVGETSDLIDAPDAYYLVRLDSLTNGGQQTLAEVKEDIRRRLASDKRVEKLRPLAEAVSMGAQQSSLEAAAAQAKVSVEKSQPFARVELVPGLGQFTQAIGAAFTVPVGKVSPPVQANDAMVVLRVDSRTEASKPAFEAQKGQQRGQLTQQLKQQRVEDFMANLRENNKVEDHRTKVMAQMRRQSAP